jgi:hypothetical protein
LEIILKFLIFYLAGMSKFLMAEEHSKKRRGHHHTLPHTVLSKKLHNTHYNILYWKTSA